MGPAPWSQRLQPLRCAKVAAVAQQVIRRAQRTRQSVRTQDKVPQWCAWFIVVPIYCLNKRKAQVRDSNSSCKQNDKVEEEKVVSAGWLLCGGVK